MYRDLRFRHKKKYLKYCILRDVKSWYASYYSYYLSRSGESPKGSTLLAKAILLLTSQEDTTIMSEVEKRIFLKHEKTLVKKLRDEGAGFNPVEKFSFGFLKWFSSTIKVENLMHELFGTYLPREREGLGLLTFRAITLLFEDPLKVLSMKEKEFDRYFASGQYREDVICDFFLDFDHLTDQLCSMMIDELGYDREIVLFLKANLGRQNVSDSDKKIKATRVINERRTDGLHEEIYEKYLLPLKHERMQS